MSSINNLRNITLAIMIILCTTYFSQQCYADNIGVSSTPININDAIKGVSYYHTLTLHNNNPYDVNITLNTNGKIKDWIHFYDYDNASIEYTELVLEKNVTRNIIIRIDVPENASNQLYLSEIIIQEEEYPTKGNQSAFVRWQYPLKVNINVTGEQNLHATIDTLFVNSNEVGYPVITSIKMINTGNVVAEPEVYVNITKGFIPVISLLDITQQINPGSFHNYQFNWDTSGMVPGDYQAHIQIILGGNIINNETITFKLFKVGELLREGSIENVALLGISKKGESIRLTAQFLNTGEIEVQAQLMCDIHIDGKYQSTKRSENRTVQKGRIETYHITYIIPRNGTYTLENYFRYDDYIGYKETNRSELTFTIGIKDSSNILIFSAVGILSTILIISFIIYKKRQRPIKNN